MSNELAFYFLMFAIGWGIGVVMSDGFRRRR